MSLTLPYARVSTLYLISPLFRGLSISLIWLQGVSLLSFTHIITSREANLKGGASWYLVLAKQVWILHTRLWKREQKKLFFVLDQGVCFPLMLKVMSYNLFSFLSFPKALVSWTKRICTCHWVLFMLPFSILFIEWLWNIRLQVRIKQPATHWLLDYKFGRNGLRCKFPSQALCSFLTGLQHPWVAATHIRWL